MPQQHSRSNEQSIRSSIAGVVWPPTNWFKYSYGLNPAMYDFRQGKVRILGTDKWLGLKGAGWHGTGVHENIDPVTGEGIRYKDSWFGLSGRGKDGVDREIDIIYAGCRDHSLTSESCRPYSSFPESYDARIIRTERELKSMDGQIIQTHEQYAVDTKRSRLLNRLRRLKSLKERSGQRKRPPQLLLPAPRPDTNIKTRISKSIMRAVPSADAIKTFGKGFTKGTVGVAVKGGVLALKGMALWQLGKTIATASTYVVEPMGRAAIETLDTVLETMRNMQATQMGGFVPDGYLSTGAATERQRALQAISKAHINGRSVLGQEASFLHR